MLRVASLIVLVVLGLAAPAAASTVEVVLEPEDRGPWANVHYRAAPQESNRVLLSTVDDTTIDVSDPGATISPGRGCRSLDAHLARCSTAGFPGVARPDRVRRPCRRSR